MIALKAPRAFALHLAISTIPLAGSAAADTLAVSQMDFSTSGYTGALSPQTPVNGFQYGFYDSPNATTGLFSTANMIPTTGTYPSWRGSEGSATPLLGRGLAHTGSLFSPAVRRYTVGIGGEPAYTGEVRIAGRFFDLDTGKTDAFIAVDPDGDGGPAPRTLLLPVSPIRDVDGAVNIDVTTNVAPGMTIDFGILPSDDNYYSDTTGFHASIVTGATAVPTRLLASGVGSANLGFSASSQDLGGLAFTMVTDGVTGSTDEESFDTSPGNAFPYHFAGLLYRENPASGKAELFDSVRIDLTTAGDFTEVPKLYLLRHNSDPGASNPAADDRYARLPVLPVRIASNSAGQPAYTFDLSGLPAAWRTGYGFAVAGTGAYTNGSIVVSEISASAVRVSDSAVIVPQPFLVEGPGNHRYGFGTVRGNWEQVETSAILAGGHLVSIDDATENAYLVSQFGLEKVYIGLKQDPEGSEPAGGWRWRTGGSLDDPGAFINWNSGEPNGYEGVEEDYAMMNISRAGGWDDVRVGGYPSLSTYRGLIEVPTPDPASENYFLADISARSNIFDAGLASPTQGGVLPPSIDVSGMGGRSLVFPQIVGVIDTLVDRHGPDGAHTAGRSCDLNAVGGISGYLNDDNTPALVGVFLAASQPASPPDRLDFSATGLGENFNSLAPALGQVFFIGDGANLAGILQNFTIPAGAVKLYFGVPDGNDGILYHGNPLGWGDNSGSVSLRASLVPLGIPTITNATFPFTGGPLVISGGVGPYVVTLSNGSLPTGLAISTAGVVTGNAAPGAYGFTVRVTDSLNSISERIYIGTIAPTSQTSGSMVAWWPAENAVGEIIGGSHVAVASGNQNYVAGKVGQAFDFNGIDQSAATPSATDILNQLPLTIEGWVKPQAHATGSIADPLPPNVISNDRRNSGGHGFGVHIYPDGSKLNIGVQGVGVDFHNVPGLAFVPGVWVHIAVVYTTGQAKTYVDGVLKSTANYQQDALEGDPIVRIGRHNDDTGYGARRFFLGAIDELSVYNKPLNAAEIAGIHLAGASGKTRWDAALEFSAAQNPGAVWSYHSAPSSAGTYTPPGAGQDLLPGPYTAFADAIVLWGTQAVVTFNGSGAPLTVPAGGTVPASSSQYDWRPGQLGMSPGSDNTTSVVRWTAPQAGKYAVSGTFYGTDTHPTSTDVHIYHNSVQLSPEDKRAVSSYRGNGVSHTQTIDAAANDTVDFVVGAGPGGNTYDSAGLAASVVRLDASAIAAWRKLYFDTPENSGAAADAADPDHDGFTNLLEFASATDPEIPNPILTPISPPQAGNVEFTYTRSKAAMAELTYQVEWSDDLLGPWHSAGVTETLSLDDGETQRIKAILPSSPNGRRFIHLKIERR